MRIVLAYVALLLSGLVGCFAASPQPVSQEPVAISEPFAPGQGAATPYDEVAPAPTSTPGASPTAPPLGGVVPLPQPQPNSMPVFVSPPAAVREEDAKNYRMGVGDKVRFDVHGEPKLSFEYDVPESGKISYPWIGDLVIDNRTVEEVRQELYTRLEADYLVDPKVFVRVTEYKSKPVEIIGPVKNPGTYYLISNTIDIIRLVALAGGFEEGRGSYATIEHRDRRLALSVDLSALVDRGDLSWNKTLYPGDTVVISNRSFEDLRNTQVSILGQVNKAGAIPWQPGLTLPNAIARAGGPTQYGALSRTEVIRTRPDGTREKIDVDLEDIEESGSFELIPGDIVRIPESRF